MKVKARCIDCRYFEAFKKWCRVKAMIITPFMSIRNCKLYAPPEKKKIDTETNKKA